MEPRVEESRVLADLGLTTIQARAYLALCRIGASQSKAISRESKIARQDTYRTLVSLQEMGLVEKAIGTPALFSPIPLQDAVDVLMERRAVKSRELSADTQRMLLDYGKNGDRTSISFEEAQFVLVPQGRACMLKGKKAILASQESIECVTSYNRFMHMMFMVGEEIIAALGRGVRCRFILGKPENNNSLSKTLSDLCRKPLWAARYLVDLPKTLMSRFDNREILIATSVNGGFLLSSMLWSNDPPLLSMTKDYFETQWNKAVETPIMSK